MRTNTTKASPANLNNVVVKISGPAETHGVQTFNNRTGHVELTPGDVQAVIDQVHHTHETAKIGDYRPDINYAVGDTVYYEGHIWRAIKHGFLLPPDKPQGTAIVYFNAPGYSKNPYRVTVVAPAPPAGIPHTPFDMHLEYISDTNFHLYKPFGPTWQKITGITTKVWRSEGVPAIPFPNHATMWIYSAPDTSPPPVAGQNDWTSLKFNEYLSGLSDCAFDEMPRPGQSLVYNGGIHRWIPGQPAFKVPDYSEHTSYSPGDTVYYQGQFWRNIWTTGQTFSITPAMTPNGAVGFFRHGGLNIGPIMAEFVEVGDPTVAPTGHVDRPLGKHYALKWQSDTSWSVWEWAVISHNPTVWGWKQVTLAHVRTWRNFALPAPVTEEDTGQLWIYAAPGTTTPPVVPQRHWEPVPLGDFLVSMADVDAINAKTGDTLVYDGHGKWVATGISGGGGGMSIPGVTAGANMPLMNDMSGVNRADGFITGLSVVNGYNTRNLLATNLRFGDGNSNEQTGIVQQTQSSANAPLFNMSILARQQSLAIYGETIANGTARNGYATLTVFPRNVNDLGFERAINELSWTAATDGVYPTTSGEYTQRSKRNSHSNHRFRASSNTTGGVSELLFQATPTNTTLTVKGTTNAPMVFSGNSVLTQDYADTRYHHKVAAAMPGVVEVDAGNGKTLVFTDGILTEVRTAP